MIVNPGLIKNSGVRGLLNRSPFWLPFNDLGSGAVDTVLARGTGSATFTRATTATTVNSAGLIVSVASGVARSYYDPTTLEYRGYIAEGARTNRILWSEDLSNAAWVKRGATSPVQGAVDPYGGSNGWTLTVGQGGVDDIYQINGGFVAAEAVAGSFWIKKVTNNKTLVCGNSSGTGLYQINLALLGSGYEWITPNHPAVTVSAPFVATAGGAAGLLFYSFDNTPIQFIYGVSQQEAGTFASTYIPTTTAAVTKNIDVDSYPTSGNIIAASGSYFGKVTFTHAPSGTVFLWGTYVDASNYTALLHDGTNLIFRKRIAGVNTDATQALTFAAGTQYKVACSWGASGQLIAINGTSGTSHANTTAAQIGTTIQIGADGNGANAPFAATAENRFYQTQLSASQLQVLTT